MAIREKTTTGYLERDTAGNIVFETGTTVPGDVAGYAKNATFVDSDVADGTSGLYSNKGTTTSADFTLVTQA